jgi:hypothetical protein
MRGELRDERSYCSERSLAQREPLAGTADQVDVWILLEYVPVWSAKATTDNALAPPTREWLRGLVDDVQQRGLKPRLQFIRQPEIDRTGVTLFVAANGVLRRFDAPDYARLTELSLATALTASGVSAMQYFVCTNGQRDLCCARFGLPVYTALREHLADRVWQTTHVGGHRFAPNILVLPQEALYGRVNAGDVDQFVARIEQNRLAAAWLRGRTRYAPEVQAAEAALAARGIDTSGSMSSAPDRCGGYRVGFGSNVVTVKPGPAYDVMASCGDESAKPVIPWFVSES